MSDQISDGERLGRCVTSSRDVKAYQRSGAVPASVFEPWNNCRSSVIRLDKATYDEAVEQGAAVARNRGANRKFYAWAIVIVQDATRSGRRVDAAPLPGNPHHADIILPAHACGVEGLEHDHAGELARYADWRDKEYRIDELPTDPAGAPRALGPDPA